MPAGWQLRKADGYPWRYSLVFSFEFGLAVFMVLFIRIWYALPVLSSLYGQESCYQSEAIAALRLVSMALRHAQFVRYH